VKIVHIADVHWRGLSRHDEYKESFSYFYKSVRDLSPDVIYIGGDIVHSKTQGISPELIESLTEWFREMASICPVHIILGNHDGLMLNKNRQDAISPIVEAMSNPNIHLYKKSGVYDTGVDGFKWCVFSCFDELGWKNVEPDPESINIALFHGGVLGSKTDIDWDIEGEVDVEFFKRFDFTLLGDIHRKQYLDSEKRIAYCGSTIQQNYGEDPGKGFLFWEIKNRDEFTSTFYKVKHAHPFVTIDWDGNRESTLESAKKFPNGSRFRIRANTIISQADIEILCSDIKRTKDAKEVVLKIENNVDVSRISTSSGEILKNSLREATTHQMLIRSFYADSDISEDDWKTIDPLIDKYVSQMTSGDSTVRNARWSINNFEFDNLFSYGKDNRVNFDNIKGITGIFGKNRIGKSSLIGSIMYTLFNTTDRGSIKNIHVVNSRKKKCTGKIDFTVNGTTYRVTRSTTKHQTRKGEVYASTSLDLSMIDISTGQEIDLNEEQRRETDKILRNLIGSSEDFLLTSLASQGEMNSFIKQGATSRKAILSKFLDLGVFDKMCSLVKEDSSSLRSHVRSLSDNDWGEKIENLSIKLESQKDELVLLKRDLRKKRKRAQTLRAKLASATSGTVTQGDIDRQRKKIEDMSSQYESLEIKMGDIDDEIDAIDEKLYTISEVKNNFPIEEIRSRLSSQRDIEKSLESAKSTYEVQLTTLKNQEKSVRLLSEVPCGDKFPSCKFINDSHKNKKNILKQKSKTAQLLRDVNDIEKKYKAILKENLEDAIEKCETIIQKENNLRITVADLRAQRVNIELTLANLNNNISSERNAMQDMIANICTDDSGTNLRSLIDSISQEIDNDDRKIILASEKVGKMKVEMSIFKRKRRELEKFGNSLKAYDFIMRAWSKRGIPLKIITDQLPAINSEIANILQGVAGFTVELYSDIESNSMDVFINYGDSRRVIELASGMEKMMASLAIRVALINISSLPKTDFIIIDEGFGSLDDSNIEACSRLLESLKKYFKTIMIISHVDAIKDSVDNILDITSYNKNAKIYHQ
tara:strand:+ start:33132 stop:36257 length:3126 start_codon:yes stop_codon:yes gene_type:complete